MLKNILKLIAIFVIGVVGGIFADQILWPYFIEKPLFSQYRLEQGPINITEKKETIITENVALTNAIGKVEKSVIGVRSTTKAGKILEGSGLIITSDGLGIVFADLVPQGSKNQFFLEGKALSFQILKRDLNQNLALIKFNESNLSTVGFADQDKIKLGERVFIVGVTFNKDIPRKAVNAGIVTSLDSDLVSTNIFEKNSLYGSPLFDIEGNFVGLNRIDKDGRVTAIPVSKIKAFVGL